MPWEFDVLNWIQTLHTDWLTPVLRVLTTLEDHGLMTILLAALFLVFPKTRKTGFTLAVTMVFCGLFGNVLLKPLIGRVRPYDVNTQIQLLIPSLHDFSFPSGHTYAAFALATCLLFFHKKWGIVALVYAVILAFSRMYFYVHYPTDIVAGIAFGVGFSFLALWITSKVWPKLPARFTGETKEAA